MLFQHCRDATWATWAAGRKALDARHHKVLQPGRAKRLYLLTGVLECSCGRRLHGQTRSSRNHEWRYYLCRNCGRAGISVSEADVVVLDELRRLVLPREAVERAREELRQRLAVPSRGASDERHARLERRLERLKTQFEWGDIEAAEYRAKMQETRAELALLPEPGRSPPSMPSRGLWSRSAWPSTRPHRSSSKS